MTLFTWQHCDNDVYAMYKSRTVDSYAQNVMRPGLSAIDGQIEDFAQRKDGWAPFAKADMEELRIEALKAFALALQSLWERQLRAYIAGCAAELKLDPSVSKMALATQKAQVEQAFYDARGISLHQFPSFATLEVLHLIGNICRHGDGMSVKALHRLRPDLWPETDRHPVDFQAYPHVPTANSLKIAPELLDQFVSAITQFWYDVETIYLQSIRRKHDNVIAELAKRKMSGAWMPTVKELTERS